MSTISQFEAMAYQKNKSHRWLKSPQCLTKTLTCSFSNTEKFTPTTVRCLNSPELHQVTTAFHSAWTWPVLNTPCSQTKLMLLCMAKQPIQMSYETGVSAWDKELVSPWSEQLSKSWGTRWVESLLHSQKLKKDLRSQRALMPAQCHLCIPAHDVCSTWFDGYPEMTLPRSPGQTKLLRSPPLTTVDLIQLAFHSHIKPRILFSLVYHM